MRNVVRALALMIEISLRADTPRSIGTALTASATRVAQPLRAIGIRTLTDGIVAANLPLAVTGIVVIIGLTIVSRITFWASFNVRMRLRESTLVYLDTLIMRLTAGIPGLRVTRGSVASVTTTFGIAVSSRPRSVSSLATSMRIGTNSGADHSK